LLVHNSNDDRTKRAKEAFERTQGEAQQKAKQEAEQRKSTAQKQEHQRIADNVSRLTREVKETLESLDRRGFPNVTMIHTWSYGEFIHKDEIDTPGWPVYTHQLIEVGEIYEYDEIYILPNGTFLRITGKNNTFRHENDPYRALHLLSINEVAVLFQSIVNSMLRSLSTLKKA
jgi:hypothetical protein